MSTTETVRDLKDKASRCPMHTKKHSAAADDFWPNKLDLKPLGVQQSPASCPTGGYKEAFLSLDLDAVIADLTGEINLRLA